MINQLPVCVGRMPVVSGQGKALVTRWDVARQEASVFLPFGRAGNLGTNPTLCAGTKVRVDCLRGTECQCDLNGKKGQVIFRRSAQW